MIVTDVRVAREDMAAAIRCFASEILVGVETDPPASGPECQLTVALTVDQAVPALRSEGIEVLAARERELGDAPGGAGRTREIETVMILWRREDGRRVYSEHAYDEALSRIAAKIENRHGVLRGIGSTLREAFEELRPALTDAED